MKKKVIALLIMLAMLCSLFAACGKQQPAASVKPQDSTSAVEVTPEPPESAPEVSDVMDPSAVEGEAPAEPFVLPITDEPVTLTYWMRQQPFMGIVEIPDEEMTYWVEMEARTGVHMDIQPAMYFTAQENFQLMIASGDWTDIIECVTDYYIGGGGAAIAEEVILPLDPLMDEYMPNYKRVLENDEMFNFAVRTRENHEVYTAGYLQEAKAQDRGLVIRQDWLDQVNMDIPETYDELHDVLTAFKGELGHRGALWAQPTMTDCWEYGYNVSLWDTETQDRAVNVIDGEVVYAPTSDQALAYVTMMNEWYQEGLIWEDFLTGTSAAVEDSVVLNGTVGIWMSSYGVDQVGTYADAAPDPNFKLSPVPFTKQDREDTIHVKLAPSYMSGGASISKSCENVEIAARWIDYNYTEDGYLLNNYGIEGEGLAYDENGSPHISELYYTNPNYATVQCLVLYSRFGGPAVADVERENYYFTDVEKEIVSVWNQDFDDLYCYPNVNILTTEESSELNAIYTDISVIMHESLVAFITGQKPLSEWDAYVKTIQDMGIDRYVEILQTAYDRYLETL